MIRGCVYIYVHQQRPTGNQRGNTMAYIVYKKGNIEIWAVKESYGFDYYVYGVMHDPIMCPSLSVAMSKIH